MKFKLGEPFKLSVTRDCGWCGGEGMISEDGSFGPCKWCGGSGEVETSI